MRKRVQPEGYLREPYEIGQQLHRTIQTKALMLELNALRDELAVYTMEHPDQVRRQRLLVQAQRDEAERLRDFLNRTSMKRAMAQRAGEQSSGTV